jgi:hypothetical protein
MTARTRFFSLLLFFFFRIYLFVPYFEKKARHGHGASGIYVATTTGKGNEVSLYR